MAGRIVKPQKLKDGGDQSQAASAGDYCRPIATKRRTCRNLAADCGNVGQRLVEIAHFSCLNFTSQSIRARKVNASPVGSRRRLAHATGIPEGQNYTATSTT